MIQPLSPEIIRLIAAGEVVQHPTSAAKELIENALDAGATSIEISATKSGTETLSVVDNGSGMSREDLALAWQRHTTSKIRSLGDLQAISHFGFRGEALNSLAEMARLEIRTRRAEDPVAHEIVLENGSLVQDITAVAGKVGTKVTVRALFAGVPGRRRPRAATTESRELIQLVSAYAVLFPEIEWQLKIDDKHFSWPKSQTLSTRANQQWGGASAHESWPVLGEFPWGRVVGQLGHPKFARRRAQGIVGVNGRWIEWPRLEQAMKASFGTLLEAQMHPSWVLHFTIDPAHIDPNIHPNKKEIRVYQENEILSALQPLIVQSLQEHFLRTQKEVLWRVAESAPEQAAGKTLKSKTFLPALDAPNVEIAQFNKLYLATHTEHGLLLIDQHAAHERVLYETFLSAWNEANHAPEKQELTPAVTVQVGPADNLALFESQELLESLGWQIEPFGEKYWVIRSLPRLLSDRDPGSLLRGMLDDLEAEVLAAGLHPHHHRLLSTLACRSAIKAGQELSLEARKELIRQLAETSSSYACPHGRPVSVLIPWKEVEEWFHR